MGFEFPKEVLQKLGYILIIQSIRDDFFFHDPQGADAASL